MLEVKESFKYRLEKALTLRGMKPIDLVRKTKISESAISQYRKGLTEPKRDRLVQIANALSVNPSWLLGLDVPMEVSQTEQVDYIDTETGTLIEPKVKESNQIDRIETFYRVLNSIKQLNDKGIEELDKHIKLLLLSDEYRSK